MQAFYKLVRQALKYRLTVGLSLFCSLMVGLLWGANIGTLYPVIEVVFRGESMVQSVRRNIDESQRHVEKLQTEISELESQITMNPSSSGKLESAISSRNSRIDAEHRSTEKWQRIEPWVANYLPSDPMTTLLVVMGILLCATILKGIFISLNEILVARITLRSMFDLRKLFYRRAIRWDLATFTEDRTSRLMSRFTHDLARIGEGLQTLFGRAMHEPMKIAVCLLGAGLICWRLLIVSFVLAPLGILVLRMISRAARNTAEDEMSAMSDVYAHLAESFQGIKAVKAFGQGQRERRKFHVLAKTLLLRRMRSAAWRSLVKPTSEILSMSVVAISVVLGAYMVLNRETQILGITLSAYPLNPATLMLFYAFLLGASEPMKKLSGISIQLIRSASAAQRIDNLMCREPTITSPKNPVPFPDVAANIVFENVKFRYQRGDNVLHKVNLEIKCGETIALVGPNGCGKSSLVNLVNRFYDPKRGAIRINGIDLRDFRIEDLRSQIALVPQECVLFDDTVINNIRYGLRLATDEQVVAAAKQARAHDFICSKLADGYDTVIGEGGMMLSGGQRQRLALARVCLRNSQIWILDEATSSVDASTADEFRRFLAGHLRDRTVIIVSHRPEDLVLADRIVVMNAGDVVDVGTHFELLGRCDYYQQMHDVEIRKAA